MSLRSVIEKLNKGKNLEKADLEIIVQYFVEKKANDKDIEDLILAWREKKETASELALLVGILYELEPKIKIQSESSYLPILDLCGTGGDKLNTINISTLSAIVTSSCGVNVIKHSGKSSTSVSGSVDILDTFGVNVDLLREKREKVFSSTKLMFISSLVLRELFSNAKRIGKKINIPSFVNLLGPLVNPYETDYQILGVSKPAWGDLMSEALVKLGKKKALIVCSELENNLFMDELSFCGKNHIWEINSGNITKYILNEKEIKNTSIELSDLTVKNVEESKECFENVLKGKNEKYSPMVETVALNAGAALYISNFKPSIKDGYETAIKNIKNGSSWEHFQNHLSLIKKV